MAFSFSSIVEIFSASRFTVSKRTREICLLAEGVGFEPTVRYNRTPDFESGAFDLSATLPIKKRQSSIARSRESGAQFSKIIFLLHIFFFSSCFSKVACFPHTSARQFAFLNLRSFPKSVLSFFSKKILSIGFFTSHRQTKRNGEKNLSLFFEENFADCI